ncbi:MAG: carbohydrate ABC transporter permease [Conexibacter sp.]
MHRYTRWTALREAAYWLALVPILVPVYFLVELSLKHQDEAASAPLSLPAHPTLDNYSQAWSQGAAGTVSFSGALVNSVLITTVVVVLLVVLGAPAGYALARRTSRLSGALFGVFVVGIILPAQLGLIPLFVLMGKLGLSGTKLSLVLVYLGLLLPLAVFLYTGFFRTLPRDYEEAARVDGASHLQVFAHVVLPLVRPVTGTVAVLCGLLVWKDFFTPLIFVGGTGNLTLPVAIYGFVGQYVTNWQLIFASIVIALAPILVIYGFLQRYILKGFVSGVRG